jgi:Leucine-rich repeat (LRR) protein
MNARTILSSLALYMSLCFAGTGGHAVTCVSNFTPSNPDASYLDRGDGTVTHTPTGLTWKRCSEGQTWSGSNCIGSATTVTWSQALNMANASRFVAQSDWRLPNLKELRTLVEECRVNPSINDTVFPNTPSSGYWSSSPFTLLSSQAWYVAFGDGRSDYSFTDRNSGLLSVRLVRMGDYSSPFLLTVAKTGNGTVISSISGINCGNACSAQFTRGTSVTLTATPSTGSSFTGWSGDCSGTGSCVVSMTAAQSVTANFAVTAAPPVCTLSASPSSIAAGASSTLTANCSPAATSYSWTGGACAGTNGSSCTVTPSTNTTYTVTGANSAGSGSASATVTVTAPVAATLTTPAPGSKLVGSSVTFGWTSGAGISAVKLQVGTTLYGFDLYDKSQGSSLSATVSDLPTDGRTIYVTLLSLFPSGWQTSSYTYTASGGNLAKPQCSLTASPTSIVEGGSATLSASCTPAATSYIWSGGVCVTTTGASCTVSPQATTTYAVAGMNSVGTGASASATVTVTSQGIPASERAVLVNLYNASNGARWTDNTGWLGAEGTECAWAGIWCNASMTHVTEIDLNGNNLVGTLPAIGELKLLEYFDVGSNQLSGAIPSLAGLTSLYYLDVYANQLTGNIPSLTGLSALEYFDVSSNQLSGAIPPLAGLTSLYYFDVGTNQLTGNIPSLTELTALRSFYVYNNQLTGSIPSLSGLTALQYFVAWRNQLTGAIPSLNGLVALKAVGLEENQLSGNIPAFTGLVALEGFYVSRNTLTGGIPALTGLTAMQKFYVGQNQLSGSIPSLNELPALKEFFAPGNLLTGSIPSLVGLTKLEVLDVSNNRLSGVVPYAPSTLKAGGSKLCGNSLRTSGSTAVDAVWATATGLDWLTCQSSVSAPVCSLSASPTYISSVGTSSTLAANCSGTPTAYTWTGGTCAGTTAATCTVAPSTTTTYSVAGVNAGGIGAAASATVTVINGDATATMVAPQPGTKLSGSTATFSWTAGTGASEYWLDVGTSGGKSDLYDKSQGSYLSALVTGLPTNGATIFVTLHTLTASGWSSKAYTYIAASSALDKPVCTVSASPVVISAGSASTLTTSCNPAATSYTWTNTGFASTASNGTVTPTKPTQYTVTGVNAAGTGNQASAAVYVCNTLPAQNYAGLTLSGTRANEQFRSGIANDTIDGGPGFDTVFYQCNRDAFTVTKTVNGWTVSSKAEGLDTLTDVERIQFGNETLALDISGVAGQAYRIYQAAFNRVPDNGGLKYWISQMDAGMSQLEVAARFVDSDEFRSLYGTNPTNAEFLTRLYSNVLHRTPDPGGYAWWLGELDAGRYNKVTALAGFSESPENQAGVLNAIINGIDLLN